MIVNKPRMYRYSIYFIFFLFISCASKKQEYKRVMLNTDEFVAAKNYLMGNYKKDNTNIWIHFDEDSEELQYVGYGIKNEQITDPFLNEFCQKQKISSINIQWKTHPGDYYLFKDSILTFEFQSFPYIEKRKKVYFDFSHISIVENNKDIFKVKDSMYLIYIKPTTY